MDTIFRDLVQNNEMVVYMDDTSIATLGTLEDHQKIVRQVLQLFHDNDLYLKLSWDEVRESQTGDGNALPVIDEGFWALTQGLDWAREAELEMDS